MSKLSFTLCVTIRQKQSSSHHCMVMVSMKEQQHVISTAIYNTLTHGFYFHMDISAMK